MFASHCILLENSLGLQQFRAHQGLHENHLGRGDLEGRDVLPDLGFLVLPVTVNCPSHFIALNRNFFKPTLTCTKRIHRRLARESLHLREETRGSDLRILLESQQDRVGLGFRLDPETGRSKQWNTKCLSAFNTVYQTRIIQKYITSHRCTFQTGEPKDRNKHRGKASSTYERVCL